MSSPQGAGVSAAVMDPPDTEPVTHVCIVGAGMSGLMGEHFQEQLLIVLEGCQLEKLRVSLGCQQDAVIVCGFFLPLCFNTV